MDRFYAIRMELAQAYVQWQVVELTVLKLCKEKKKMVSASYAHARGGKLRLQQSRVLRSRDLGCTMLGTYIVSLQLHSGSPCTHAKRAD
jgi:hypothetical protein